MEKLAAERFMRMAIELSENNVKQNLGGPFGAVIVKNGLLIAASANRVIIEKDPTAHAEITAIRMACLKLGTHNLSGCEIYTSCEPCPMCLGAIYWAHIDKIYYANTKADATNIGFDDYFIYKELELDMENRKLSFIPLLHDEAIAAFKLWELSGLNKND
jgi:tRNA(Arg) A34 adenosine deaminase TadA